jgi:predicted HTH domain antitoxin
MTKINLDLPPEVFSARRLSPDDFVRDMRLAAAIYWYQKAEISQEKAAQIADLNRRDFLAALAREQVDVFSVDFDDLEQELARD